MKQKINKVNIIKSLYTAYKHGKTKMSQSEFNLWIASEINTYYFREYSIGRIKNEQTRLRNTKRRKQA